MIRTSMNLFKAWCNQHVAGNAHVQYRLLASSPSVDDKPVLYYTKCGWKTVRLVRGVPCFIINNLIYTGLRFLLCINFVSEVGWIVNYDEWSRHFSGCVSLLTIF